MICFLNAVMTTRDTIAAESCPHPCEAAGKSDVSPLLMRSVHRSLTEDGGHHASTNASRGELGRDGGRERVVACVRRVRWNSLCRLFSDSSPPIPSPMMNRQKMRTPMMETAGLEGGDVSSRSLGGATRPSLPVTGNSLTNGSNNDDHELNSVELDCGKWKLASFATTYSQDDSPSCDRKHRRAKGEEPQQTAPYSAQLVQKLTYPNPSCPKRVPTGVETLSPRSLRRGRSMLAPKKGEATATYWFAVSFPLWRPWL